MEYASVVFVGGFGASTNYAERMCVELQRLLSRKVYNFSLLHGCTLEEECAHIISKLQGKGLSSHPYILMGFSTGCLVVMRLSETISTQQVILLNPAEVLTRLNLNILESLVHPEDWDRNENISTYLPMLQRSGYSVTQWKVLWSVFTCVWWLALTLLGSSRVAKLYYKHFGHGFHEPRADELERLLFAPRRRLNDLRETLIECILKPSLQSLIRRADRTINIVEGDVDLLYIPYVRQLYHLNKNVLFHRTIGDHHMIYHHPVETAQKLSAVIKVRAKSSF